MMRDVLYFLLLVVLDLPLTILVNRLQLRLLPARQELPGQGTIVRSSLFVFFILSLAGASVLGATGAEKGLWLVYLSVVLLCEMLVFVSVMCVSESGRRFYFMSLIEKAGILNREDLQEAYGKKHMLSIRIERLSKWGVLQEIPSGYVLKRRVAYYYSLFFQLWGRLLGFDWFRMR
jgi:hypothetical protein